MNPNEAWGTVNKKNTYILFKQKKNIVDSAIARLIHRKCYVIRKMKFSPRQKIDLNILFRT